MIPAFIQATLHPLIAGAFLVAIPHRALIKDRFQHPAADEFIESTSHAMTLLEELQARILAKIDSGTESGPIAAHIQIALSSQTEDPTFLIPNSAPDPRQLEN